MTLLSQALGVSLASLELGLSADGGSALQVPSTRKLLFDATKKGVGTQYVEIKEKIGVNFNPSPRTN